MSITDDKYQGTIMTMNRESIGTRLKTPRWLKMVAAGTLGVILLTGCSTFYPSGRGMMGSSSRYYSSKVSCTPPAGLPGQNINVAVSDMGMSRMMGGDAALGGRMRLGAVPDSFAAGKVSIIVTNLGWRTHELVIMPLSAGQSAGQRIPRPDGKVDETGSLGEASNSCGAGIGDGITAGSVSWTTVTLAPGRYEFICNLKNHYANGMYQEVLVTA